LPATKPALIVRPVELPDPGVSLRVARTGVADGPAGETTTLRVMVPTKPFELVKCTDAV